MAVRHQAVEATAVTAEVAAVAADQRVTEAAVGVAVRHLAGVEVTAEAVEADSDNQADPSFQ